MCPVVHNSAKLVHIQLKNLEISVSHPLRTSVPDAQALCAMLRWRILIFLNVNLRHFCARLRKWFGRSRCGRDNLSSTPCGVILFFLAAIGRQWRAPPFPPRRKQKTSRYRCLQLERCRGKLIHTRASAATREKRAWQEKQHSNRSVGSSENRGLHLAASGKAQNAHLHFCFPNKYARHKV